MKTDKITTRIENGNSLADKVAKYLNFRFKYEFEKASIEEDKKLMIDYKCKKSNKTAQMKCRENKSDIIYEAKRFYSNNASSYEEANGRDVRTEATLYICLSADKRQIIVAETEAIKKIVQKEIQKLEITLHQVKQYEQECAFTRNKTKKLASNKSRIEVWFKIDEGIDSRHYSKLLVFIPYSAIFESVVIDLRNNENIEDERTWKNG